MYEFIQKILYIFEKKKHLMKIKCESNYVRQNFERVLSKDVQALREKMAELKQIKDPKTTTKETILNLEKEIEEVMYYRNVLTKGKATERELKLIIDATKKYLWQR